jgi:hypothetical protein
MLLGYGQVYMCAKAYPNREMWIPNPGRPKLARNRSLKIR